MTTAFALSPQAVDTLVTTSAIDAGPTRGESLIQWAGFTIAGAVVWAFITDFLWEGAMKPVIDMSGQIGDKLKEKNCHILDKRRYECEQALNITMSLYRHHWHRFAIDHVFGNVRGLVLGGRIAGLRELSAPTGAITTSDFVWTFTGGCREGYRIVNRAEIDMGGDAVLCGATILDDPDGEYATWVDTEAGTVEISPNFKTAYMNRPDAAKYAAKVRVITTLECARSRSRILSPSPTRNVRA